MIVPDESSSDPVCQRSLIHEARPSKTSQTWQALMGPSWKGLKI